MDTAGRWLRPVDPSQDDHADFRSSRITTAAGVFTVTGLGRWSRAKHRRGTAAMSFFDDACLHPSYLDIRQSVVQTVVERQGIVTRGQTRDGTETGPSAGYVGPPHPEGARAGLAVSRAVSPRRPGLDRR